MAVPFFIRLCFGVQFLFLQCHANIPNHLSSNGDPIEIGTVPYNAAIFIHRAGSQPADRYLCSATIISTEFVLTAAQCGFMWDELVVRVGFSNSTESPGQVYPVQVCVPHPQFDRDTLQLDIALLKLARPMRFSETVQPIAMLPEGAFLENYVLATAYRTAATIATAAKKHQTEVILRRLNFFTVNTFLCNLDERIVTAEQLCLTDYKDTMCYGDSGAPLTVINGLSRYVLAIASNTFRQCGKPVSVGIRVDVPDVRTWIRTVTGNKTL